jgi:hypothetical protein
MIWLPPEPTWSWLSEAARMYALMVGSELSFAQANYGDGEWGCILGRSGTNSQGETYNPRLRDALRRTLLQPTGHWCGTNPGKRLKDEAEAWVKAHGVLVPWLFKETLAGANVNGHLAPFLQAVRTRKTVLVGPAHLRDLPENVIGRHHFIQVPDRTAWEVYEDTCAEVLSRVSHGCLVLFASGMATNLSIHHLWPELKGQATLLDIGAVLDPYVGVLSRKGYRKESFQQTGMAANLREAA